MTTHAIAVVGGESLLGREVRDVLSSTASGAHVKLIGTDEEEGSAVLTAQDDELALIGPLEEEALQGAKVVFLAGSPSSSRKTLALTAGKSPHPVLVDMSFGLEDHPNAIVRAPMLEPDGQASLADAVHVIAHPASLVLAMFLERLHGRYPIRRTVATILEPASERGRKGLDELQQQTISLLSFKSVPKQVYDQQLSFNVLARYGQEALEPLQAIESRVDRHLAALLARSARVPMPSLRLVQAPVFHGHSFSIWVEFESNPGAKALSEALASAQVEVRGQSEEPPNNVGIAGQSGFSVGAIEVDRNHGDAAWFWVASDNLRVSADTAVEVARPFLEFAA